MISLYKHNQDGFVSLCNMLHDTRYATINHATGTGKSFIILKYLYCHRDKRYLYIAPTYEILEQFINRDRKAAAIDANELSVDCIIYRSLLDLDMEDLYQKYDGFILDEYHRAGAPETYKQITKLKELIKNGSADKKFIGLTATPIRYLDKERNMTTELFEGNIASNISLAEAIVEGILPVPQYIIRSNSIEKEYQKTLNRINQLYPSEQKTYYQTELDKIGHYFSTEGDLTEIFTNTIKDNGNYIFFSSTIDKLKIAMEQAPIWFENFPNLTLYEVHSGMTKERIKEQIKLFDNSETGLNIMFAVDLFSEGVHPKKVDGVILNRSTTSPIIYFQQIGRTLTSANTHKTVTIYDLQGNFIAHDAIKKLYSDIAKLAQEKIAQNPQDKDRYLAIINAFKIVDTTTEYIEELKKMRTEITREVIISSKINYIIKTLENYKQENNIQDKQLSGIDIKNPGVRKLYYELFKYKEFISLKQQEQLDALLIVMPTTPNLTEEEIISSKIDYIITTLENYKDSNQLQDKQLSGINIDNLDIRKLYYELFKYKDFISKEQQERLASLSIMMPTTHSLTKEELASSKIDSFIKNLEDYLKANNLQGEIITKYNLEGDLKESYFELISYAKYINVSQMIRLQELNVVLPNFLMVTKEDREKHLQGYANEYQLEKSLRETRIALIISSLEANNLTEESELFPEYLDELLKGKTAFKSKVKELLDITQLPTWHKLLLDISITSQEQLLFYQECLKLYDQNNLPLHYEKALNKLLIKYGIGQELINKIKQDREKNTQDQDILNEIINYIDNYPNASNIQDDLTYQALFQQLSLENRKIVTNYRKELVQRKNSAIISSLVPTQSMLESVQLMKSCDLENLHLLRKKLSNQIARLKLLQEFIGLKQTASSQVDNNDFERFNDVLNDEEVLFLINNDLRKLKLSIAKTMRELNIKIDLCDYLIFCLTNKRRPVSITDEAEIALFNKYNGIRKKLPKTSFNVINDYLNTKEIISGTERQIVLNASQKTKKGT